MTDWKTIENNDDIGGLLHKVVAFQTNLSYFGAWGGEHPEACDIAKAPDAAGRVFLAYLHPMGGGAARMVRLTRKAAQAGDNFCYLDKDEIEVESENLAASVNPGGEPGFIRAREATEDEIFFARHAVLDHAARVENNDPVFRKKLGLLPAPQ